MHRQKGDINQCIDTREIQYLLLYYRAPAEGRFIPVVVSTDILCIYLHDMSTEMICRRNSSSSERGMSTSAPGAGVYLTVH